METSYVPDRTADQITYEEEIVWPRVAEAAELVVWTTLEMHIQRGED